MGNKKTQLQVQFPDGTKIIGEGSDVLLQTICRIGPEKVYNLEIRTFSNYELLTKQKIEQNSKKKPNQKYVDGYWLTHGQQNKFKKRIVEEISCKLGLKLQVDLL